MGTANNMYNLLFLFIQWAGESRVIFGLSILPRFDRRTSISFTHICTTDIAVYTAAHASITYWYHIGAFNWLHLCSVHLSAHVTCQYCNKSLQLIIISMCDLFIIVIVNHYYYHNDI